MTTLVQVEMLRGYVFRRSIEYLKAFNAEGIFIFMPHGISYKRSSDNAIGRFYNELFFRSERFVDYRFDTKHANVIGGIPCYHIRLSIPQLLSMIGSKRRVERLKMALMQQSDGVLALRVVNDTGDTYLQDIGNVADEEHIFKFTKQHHQCFVRIPTPMLDTSFKGQLPSTSNDNHVIFFVYEDALEIMNINGGQDKRSSWKFGNHETIANNEPHDYYVVSVSHMKAMLILKQICENSCISFYYEDEYDANGNRVLSSQPLRFTGTIMGVGEMTVVMSSDDRPNIDDWLPERLKMGSV